MSDEEDEFETVRHAKPKPKPKAVLCQQDTKLVERVCELARQGLSLTEIDTELHDQGAASPSYRPTLRPVTSSAVPCRLHQQRGQPLAQAV